MNPKSLIFAIIAAVLALSPQAKAQEDLQSELGKILAGSAWEGTYSVPYLNNIAGSVRIAFLPESSATGGWQYFHNTQSDSGILKAIASKDSACEFTPRTLTLQRISNENLNGTISVYSCAADNKEEIRLENDQNRKPKINIAVTKFALSNRDNSIEINATILRFNVVYHLVKHLWIWKGHPLKKNYKCG